MAENFTLGDWIAKNLEIDSAIVLARAQQSLALLILASEVKQPGLLQVVARLAIHMKQGKPLSEYSNEYPEDLGVDFSQLNSLVPNLVHFFAEFSFNEIPNLTEQSGAELFGLFGGSASDPFNDQEFRSIFNGEISKEARPEVVESKSGDTPKVLSIKVKKLKSPEEKKTEIIEFANQNKLPIEELIAIYNLEDLDWLPNWIEKNVIDTDKGRAIRRNLWGHRVTGDSFQFIYKYRKIGIRLKPSSELGLKGDSDKYYLFVSEILFLFREIKKSKRLKIISPE